MLCNRAGYQNHAPEQWAGRVLFFVSRWPLPGDFRRYPTQVLIPTQYICKNPNPQLGQIMEFELKDFVIMGCSGVIAAVVAVIYMKIAKKN